MERTEKITFNPGQDDSESFYVLEQTRLGGVNYLLVTDCEEGDGEAFIMKDISADGEEDGVLEMVSDEEELAAVAGVFENMLEDIELT